MISIALAAVYSAVVLSILSGAAVIERSSRLAGLLHRREVEAPLAQWGHQRSRPPAAYALARALAASSRLVRGKTVVADASAAMRRSSRVLCLLATASALSMIPFAGTWAGAAAGEPLVVVDLEYGLGVIVFLVLLSGLAHAATGLAERSLWARLGAIRIAGQSLIGVALLLLVLAPLVLSTSSLRPHDIVQFQQGTFSPLAPLGDGFMGIGRATIEAIQLPNWFLFRQPLTAILIVPTLGLLLRRYSVYDTMNNAYTSGFGLDSDPSDLYWKGLEARLAGALAAALFVAFFLGAGAVPFFDPSSILAAATPLLGDGMPAAIWLAIEVSVFITKALGTLYLATLLKRSTARARSDQSLHTMTRRLIPLAWANLLLLSALSLLSSSGAEAMG